LEVTEMKSKEKRILGRILAKELSLEELGLAQGSAGTIVVALADADSDERPGPKPPISTLVATLPDYHEDQ
jgi:hypothetical protein